MTVQQIFFIIATTATAILYLFYLYQRKNKRVTRDIIVKPKKWVVLLTTAVNVKEEGKSRKRLYETQIKRWLSETSLPIVVVESTNTELDLPYHPRLQIITFSLPPVKSSTVGEAISLLHAAPLIFAEHTHILKVTGRYFLSGIEDALKKTNSSTDVFIQKRGNKEWRNTEYFGIRKELLEEMVTPSLTHGLMEENFAKFLINHTYSILPSFPNNIPRGGDGLVLDPL